MKSQQYISNENELSFLMLTEIMTKPHLKETLHEVTSMIVDKILKEIHAELCQVNNIEALPKYYRDCIVQLVIENTAEKKQFGALSITSTANEILNSYDQTKLFMERFIQVLSDLSHVDSIDAVAIVMKAIVEGGTIYHELLNIKHSENFGKIYDYIWPTQEEFDIRISRDELGEVPKYAVTFGIGMEESDLSPQINNVGRIAGKSIFGTVSMKVRLQFLMEQFDKTLALRNSIDISDANEIVQGKLKDTEIKLTKFAKQLQYYGIPLLKSERKDLDYYANLKKSTFEKLANSCLPLVASVSRSVARVLICLQDLGAFDKPDGSFDLVKAQILSNCLMGFIVYGGHHSYLEVAECYNRLLDYIAIEHPEKLPTIFTSAESFDQRIRYINNENIIERKMPYYVIGDYLSFLHKSYAYEAEKMLDANSKVYKMLKIN